MDLSGKKLAILGGTRINCQFVEAAHALGMHTTVIDYYEPSEEHSPAKLISDDHVLISVAETDRVADYLRKNAFDGVVTGYSDTILGWYADICEKAELPCYGTREQFEVFTDKHRWKALCRKFDIPTAYEYGSELLDEPEESIDFPLFVKPSDASGARGATIAYNKSQLIESYKLAKSFQKKGEVLFEKYLSGPEVTVFWVFIDGQCYVNMLGNRHVKHNQKGTIPLPAGYTFPSAILPKYQKEVVPKWKMAFGELGVRNGMMFMQCSVQDGLPYVYDIGYRTTGTLEHHAQKPVAGYSTMDMLIHYACTGRMTDDEDIENKIRRGLYAPCFNISWLMKPGTIDHYVGLETLDASDCITYYKKAHIEGETLPSEAVGQLRQIALRALGTVDSSRELPAIVLSLQSLVDIVDKDGQSLVLPGLEVTDFSNTMSGI